MGLFVVSVCYTKMEDFISLFDFVGRYEGVGHSLFHNSGYLRVKVVAF